MRQEQKENRTEIELLRVRALMLKRLNLKWGMYKTSNRRSFESWMVPDKVTWICVQSGSVTKVVVMDLVWWNNPKFELTWQLAPVSIIQAWAVKLRPLFIPAETKWELIEAISTWWRMFRWSLKNDLRLWFRRGGCSIWKTNRTARYLRNIANQIIVIRSQDT